MIWTGAACLVAVFLSLPSVPANRLHSLPCRRVHGKHDNIYQFEWPDIYEKSNVTFKKFKGKILIIVNTASYSGLTWQYLELNKLKEKYVDFGFEILAFPCNQFNLGEHGANASEILNSLKHVRPGKGYVPNFSMFSKVNVNGEGMAPLYRYLKSHCPATRDFFFPRPLLFYTPFDVVDIRWNFEAFLVDRRGQPLIRYDATAHPASYSKDIERVIKLSKIRLARIHKMKKEGKLKKHPELSSELLEGKRHGAFEAMSEADINKTKGIGKPIKRLILPKDDGKLKTVDQEIMKNSNSRTGQTDKDKKGEQMKPVKGETPKNVEIKHNQLKNTKADGTKNSDDDGFKNGLLKHSGIGIRNADKMTEDVGDSSSKMPVVVGDSSSKVPGIVGDTSSKIPGVVGDTSSKMPGVVGDTSSKMPGVVGDTSSKMPGVVGDTSSKMPGVVGDTSSKMPGVVGDTSNPMKTKEDDDDKDDDGPPGLKEKMQKLHKKLDSSDDDKDDDGPPGLKEKMQNLHKKLKANDDAREKQLHDMGEKRNEKLKQSDEKRNMALSKLDEERNQTFKKNAEQLKQTLNQNPQTKIKDNKEL